MIATKILLELKSAYSKVSRYKINIQESIVFPYAINKQLKIKILKAVSFAVGEILIYRSRNLTKARTYLYNDNYKTLLIIKELNKWKDSLFSWFKRLNIVKKSIISKLIY